MLKLKKEFSNGNLSNIATEIYIDVINNNIVIGLEQYSQQNIQYFKDNIVDIPVITFKQGSEYTSTAVKEIKPGQPIKNCSVGYRAKKGNTILGFVTAAHCVTLGEKIPGFGEVKQRIRGGSIDAAWIQVDIKVGLPLNKFYSYSGSTSPSFELATTISNYLVGTKIGRIGQASKHQIGKITEIGKTIRFTDNGTLVVLNDQIETSVKQDFGDSGGIVYNSGNHSTVGIGTIQNTETETMVFSRADKINSALKISRY